MYFILFNYNFQPTENYRTYTNVHLDLRRNHFIQIQPPAFSILLHMF